MSKERVRRSVRPPHFPLLLLTGVIACESTSSPEEVYERTVTPEMVTGEALAALRPDGRFNLVLPATGPGQVSLQEAKAQAPQFARYLTNQLLLRGVVEAERGGYWTDPHLLSLCNDAYFVHSQLGTIDHDSLPHNAGLVHLRRFGPQWLLPLCGDKSEPQMTVQIAIDGNDIRFSNGEPVEPYVSLTTAWYGRGVPLDWPDALPISAERAVRFAYETLGVRVSGMPRLVFRGDVTSDGRYVWYQIGSVRFCNRWRLELEDDVNLRGAATTTATKVIHVGSFSCNRLDVTPQIHLALESQPAFVILDYVDDSVVPARTWAVQVAVVAPIRFELATRAQ